MSTDFYKVLGVERNASDDELKKAYRDLAKKHHPDRHKDGKQAEAEAKFKEINEAYDTLKDPQKRAAYDRFGHDAYQQGGAGGFHPGDMGGFGSAFSDIFESMFGDAMGGGTGGRTNGTDIQYTLDITLEDAFKGKEATIRIPSVDPCDACNSTGAEKGSSAEKCTTCDGKGRIRAAQGFFTIERTCHACNGQGTIIKNPCKKCGGAGVLRGDKTVKVTIPAGIDHGRRVRLAGEGGAAPRGGKRGDLYVLINIKPHPLFKRDEAHLFCRVPISFAAAALGGSIDVPTLSGKTSALKIPHGTQTGQQFRLKGMGMPALRGDHHGDLYIEAYIETPVNLTKKQQDLLREFQESLQKGKSHSPETDSFLDRIKGLWG